MLLVILTKKKLLARFTKKNCKGQNKNNLGWKSNLKLKAVEYMLNEKVTLILSTFGLTKRQHK